MEFGNRKLFPGVSSGAHLRPTAHPEPVIDSPTNSAQEDTRTILKRTPERYKRHRYTHDAIILRRDRCIIKNLLYQMCVTYSTCRAKTKLGRRETKRFSATSERALCQRVRRIVVETLELQKNERSLVADPAIASPRNVSRPREPSTWLRNERYFDSLF